MTPFLATLDRQEIPVEVTGEGRVRVHGAEALTPPEIEALRRQKADLVLAYGSVPGGTEPKAHRRYGSWSSAPTGGEQREPEPEPKAEEEDPAALRRRLRGNLPGEVTDSQGRRFVPSRRTPRHLHLIGAGRLVDFLAAARTERTGSPIRELQNRPRENVPIAERFNRPPRPGPAKIRGG